LEAAVAYPRIILVPDTSFVFMTASPSLLVIFLSISFPHLSSFSAFFVSGNDPVVSFSPPPRSLLLVRSCSTSAPFLLLGRADTSPRKKKVFPCCFLSLRPIPLKCLHFSLQSSKQTILVPFVGRSFGSLLEGLILERISGLLK